FRSKATAREAVRGEFLHRAAASDRRQERGGEQNVQGRARDQRDEVRGIRGLAHRAPAPGVGKIVLRAISRSRSNSNRGAPGRGPDAPTGGPAALPVSSPPFP